jgi:putative membrane protein
MMHTGKNYTWKEVLLWTRFDLFRLFVISLIPTALYVFFKWNWLSLPWLPVALLGTAVAFVVGFKNNASYDRLWEARQIWGNILNASRSWGILVKDFVTDRMVQHPVPESELRQIHRILVDRHLGWVTALRFQLREPRIWEAIYKAHNQEYKNKWFRVEEHENKMEDELKNYLSEEECRQILSKSNKAAQIIGLQSAHLRRLLELGYIEDFRHMEMENLLRELYNFQGAAERIKNFPYPRQYATLNLWFIQLFVVLLPLGMLQEFNKMGEHYVWLTVPFSVLCGWVFTTMEKIGEASESPFEGSANDVPITAISRTIEIDLRELFDHRDVPPPLKPVNQILS